MATISGTFTCSNGDSLEIYLDATQNVGRFSIRGWGGFWTSGECDGTSHPWSADLVPDNGKFAGGKALSVAWTYACGSFECMEGYTERTVFLRGKR